MSKRRAKQIIELWAEGHTGEQIAEMVDCHRDTVFFNLRRARLNGNPQADRRNGQMPAIKRRRTIRALHKQGADMKTIMKIVGVSKRTVERGLMR